MVKYDTMLNFLMEAHSTVDDWVQELDIADGLKKLLIDTDLTIESIARKGYQEVSEMLHIDQYVGKLIFEAAQNVMQRNHGRDFLQMRRALTYPK